MSMAVQEDSLGTLCEDILLNVLNRLSLKDLIKCKCVSKEWYKIISHVCVPQLSAEAPVCGVYFRVAHISWSWRDYLTSSSEEVKNQLHHQVAYSDSIHYIDSAPLELCGDKNSVDTAGFAGMFPLELCGDKKSVDTAGFAGMSYASILPFNHRGPDFLDCCNGLVLFVQRPKPQFYVCNPAIRQCVPVPLPPPSVHLSSLYASLAYDPSESIYYKVVILSVITEPQCLNVFHSQTGEWLTHQVQVELPPSTKCFQLVRHSIYLKGIVYRLSLLNKIICLDIDSLKACVINCPYQKHPPIHKGLEYPPPPGCIGVSNGSLSYVTEEDGDLCVWLLDNPNEPCEWNLKYRICFHDIAKCVKKIYIYDLLVWLRCCAFHPTSDILFLSSARSIMVYDIKNRCIRNVWTIFPNQGVVLGGYFFPIFTYRCTYVTLKNWCTVTTTENNSCEEVYEKWSFTEQ